MTARLPLAVAVLVAAAAIAHAAAPLPAAEATITVDAAAAGAPFPAALLGTAHTPRSDDVIAAVRAAGVPHMRVDAYLEDVATTPTTRDWSAFDARLATVRASGAEATLILSYTPTWLSECPSWEPAGPEYCAPTDLAAWRALVREATTRAATQWDVRDFEAWNEPDHPGFWRGTLAEFLMLYEASALGVQDAARDTGLALRFGGPATLFPDPVWIQSTLAHANARGLPVDFVSFHWYADYPLFGPIGPLPGTVVTDSPALLAQSYGQYASMVRAWADAAGFPDAEVWIDEWNVNAGDAPRMRGDFGGAFLAASVREMQRSGAVERANFFNVEDDTWGLFSENGVPRASWKAMRALLALGDAALPVAEEGAAHAGAVAARDADGAVRALVYNFNAQADVPVDVVLMFDGAPIGASLTVHDLDGRVMHEGPYPADGLRLVLPNLAVRIVEVAPAA